MKTHLLLLNHTSTCSIHTYVNPVIFLNKQITRISNLHSKRKERKTFLSNSGFAHRIPNSCESFSSWLLFSLATAKFLILLLMYIKILKFLLESPPSRKAPLPEMFSSDAVGKRTGEHVCSSMICV